MKPALLVVDVQKIYTVSDSELFCKDSEKTLKRINRLIAKFQEYRWPIYLIRHIHKLDGSDLGRMFDYTGEPEDNFNFKEGTDEIEYDSRLRIPKNARHLTKTRYSAFTRTKLQKQLKSDKIDTVVICGFMTNFCCESTAREAHDLDYFVDFVIDATGTPGTDNLNEAKIRNVVGELLMAGFARITTTNKYINSLAK